MATFKLRYDSSPIFDVDISYFQCSLVRTSKKEHDPYHPTIDITYLFFT